MRAKKAAPSEASVKTIVDRLEQLCGVRPPDSVSPGWRERFAEFEVTCSLNRALAKSDDPRTGMRAAINGLLKASALPFEELRPHVEHVLGRALMASEIEAGALAA